jgi:SAM-dependent methyltransferase
MSNFDKEYMNYWEQAVQKSVDGTVIAGPQVCAEYVRLLHLIEGQKVLDMGCSFGRLFPVLREKTSQVFGMDLDLDVINQAAKKPYSSVVLGKAEKTPFASEFFDAVMAWAVFDAVDQKKAYVEINRILKPGGRLLATGKNARYPQDDTLGFVAERNAFVKGYPNHFTDLKLLSESVQLWGFECEQVFLFEKRGDLGLNKVKENGAKDFVGYEYIVVLKKARAVASDEGCPEITFPFSFTADEKAKAKGFPETKDFLKTAYEKDWT